MAHSNMLLMSAPGGKIEPQPISGVSLTPAQTNFYLTRGTPFNVGHDPGAALRGFTEDSLGAKALPASCTTQAGCAVPPGEYCRQQGCPPLTVPFQGGCLGTTLQDGKRIGILEKRAP
jgi:hypothetical protein